MTQASPSVAVIITCYNYERYVAAAIDSVLSQSRPAAEIIVIDDGSTDNSAEVICDYGDKVIPVIQANTGKVAAVNIGYARSSADIVLFLDADDLLLDGALEAILDAWTPETVKAQFELEIIDGAGEQLGRRFCNFPQPYGPSEVRAAFERTGTYLWPVTSGNAYARSFLDKLLPMTPPVSQDGVLNTLAPLYGEVATIARPLGQYRLHGQNRSRQDAKGKAKRHPDFGRRIAFRAAEFDILRDHAQALGAALPAGDLLDSELVFVNYRLMARKLDDAYPGQERESVAGLWRTAIGLVAAQPASAKSKLANFAWLTLLLACPKGLARPLINLRFNRSEVLAPLRNALSRLRGGPTSAAPITQ